MIVTNETGKDCVVMGHGTVRKGWTIEVPDDVGRHLLSVGFRPARPGETIDQWTIEDDEENVRR